MLKNVPRGWAGLALACAAAFALWTVWVIAAAPLPGDWGLLNAVLGLRRPGLTPLMQLSAFISSALPAGLVCAGVALAAAWRAGRLTRAALWPLIAVIGAAAGNILLRIAIGRLPPPVAHIGNLIPEIPVAWQKFSYPSGHAGLAVAAYFSLAAWLWDNPRLRWPAAVAAGLAAVWAGLGRIYLGVHWPSDVLGGYLLAGVWLALGLLWRERYNH
jgi:undecaprenyl-diphosphatase